MPMSAFHVGNEQISFIALGLLSAGQHIHEMKSISTELGCNEEGNYRLAPELAQELHELNDYALVQRYGADHKMSPAHEYDTSQRFYNGKNDLTRLYQAIKCLRYQLSEGDTVAKPLYLLIGRASDKLAHVIASRAADEAGHEWA